MYKRGRLEVIAGPMFVGGSSAPLKMKECSTVTMASAMTTQKRCVYRYSISAEDQQLNQRLFLNFLDTPQGSRILEMGVAVMVEKITNNATYSIDYMVMAHFTNQQHLDYEKWEMIEKLAGNIS